MTIPESVSIGGKDYIVTSIGRAAFAGYQNVDHIVIPNTVETIEEYAFFRTSVITVTIPQSVQSIGKRAFGHCPKLKSLTLYNTETVLGEDLYTESKNVEKRYLDGGEPQPNVTQRTTPRKPTVKRPTVPVGPADVDIDIPTVSASNDETFAIIIANENYQSEVAVKYAHNDGRIFHNYCQNVLGIPEENIHYREDATLNNMQTEVNWVTNVARVYGGDARIIVYYAGHGIPDESTQTAYLLPVDGSGSDFNTGYSLDKRDFGATMDQVLASMRSLYNTLEAKVSAKGGRCSLQVEYSALMPEGNYSHYIVHPYQLGAENIIITAKGGDTDVQQAVSQLAGATDAEEISSVTLWLTDNVNTEAAKSLSSFNKKTSS